MAPDISLPDDRVILEHFPTSPGAADDSRGVLQGQVATDGGHDIRAPDAKVDQILRHFRFHFLITFYCNASILNVKSDFNI